MTHACARATDDNDAATCCRICMEGGDDDSPLIRPCACSGTQAYVHLACLRRWQQSSSNHARRFICPVCKSAYDSQYLPQKKRDDDSTPRWFKLWGGNIAGATALAAAHLTGVLPIAPFAIFVGVVLFFATVGFFATVKLLQELVGLKLCFIVDEEGFPLLRVIRVGSAIPGLRAGALLVSTDAIRGGIFDRSVVVITRHDEAGTAGYILNCPIERLRSHHAGFAAGAPLHHALAVPEAPDAVQHGVGGPVDLDRWAVLHRFDSVPGSRLLSRDLHIGGDLSTLRRAAREEAAQRSYEEVLVNALHGHSAWAAGQLEGEIRSGLWEWAADIGYEFAMSRTQQTTWTRALAAIQAAQRHA